tara:strand:- start:22296 stop:22724 length:429 start_codon:yes stop_codon:yes gene_type:complete
MELTDAAKYIELVDLMKGKYRLDFSQKKQKFAFQQREKDSSKVIGMILGGFDYMVNCSFGDILDSSFGGGFEIDGKLYELDKSKFSKIIKLAKIGSVCGDKEIERRWMKDVKDDINFLRDAEKEIYTAGLVLPEPVSRLELV